MTYKTKQTTEQDNALEVEMSARRSAGSAVSANVTSYNITLRILIMVAGSMSILSHLPIPDTDRDETSLFRKQHQPFASNQQQSRKQTVESWTPPNGAVHPCQTFGNPADSHLIQVKSIPRINLTFAPDQSPVALRHPITRVLPFSVSGNISAANRFAPCVITPKLHEARAGPPTVLLTCPGFNHPKQLPVVSAVEWLNTERPRKHDDSLFESAAQIYTFELFRY